MEHWQPSQLIATFSSSPDPTLYPGERELTHICQGGEGGYHYRSLCRDRGGWRQEKCGIRWHEYSTQQGKWDCYFKRPLKSCCPFLVNWRSCLLSNSHSLLWKVYILHLFHNYWRLMIICFQFLLFCGIKAAASSGHVFTLQPQQLDHVFVVLWLF